MPSRKVLDSITIHVPLGQGCAFIAILWAHTVFDRHTYLAVNQEDNCSKIPQQLLRHLEGIVGACFRASTVQHGPCNVININQQPKKRGMCTVQAVSSLPNHLSRTKAEAHGRGPVHSAPQDTARLVSCGLDAGEFSNCSCPPVQNLAAYSATSTGLSAASFKLVACGIYYSNQKHSTFSHNCTVRSVRGRARKINYSVVFNNFKNQVHVLRQIGRIRSSRRFRVRATVNLLHLLHLLQIVAA